MHCRFQLRCVLETPLVAPTPGCTLRGTLRLEAHSRQSYDVFVTLTAPPLEPGGLPQVRGVRRATVVQPLWAAGVEPGARLYMYAPACTAQPVPCRSGC